MRNEHLNRSFCLLTLLALSACAESRFGEPIQRDSHGGLPALTFAAVSDAEAERIYEASRLPDTLREKVETAWTRMRESLKGSDLARMEKKRRIGRLLSAASRDSTELRIAVVQLWAIRFGQEMEGAAGDEAERILLDKVIPDTDINNLVWFTSLMFLVAPPSDLTPEGRELLPQIDHFFRTGEFPPGKTARSPMPPHG